MKLVALGGLVRLELSSHVVELIEGVEVVLVEDRFVGVGVPFRDLR